MVLGNISRKVIRGCETNYRGTDTLGSKQARRATRVFREREFSWGNPGAFMEVEKDWGMDEVKRDLNRLLFCFGWEVGMMKNIDLEKI